MTVIFCVKDAYPEVLTTVTFAYFSIEVIVSGGIKIYETFKIKRKKKAEESETEVETEEVEIDETPAQPGEGKIQ
jgi:hypothetical protein